MEGSLLTAGEYLFVQLPADSSLIRHLPPGFYRGRGSVHDIMFQFFVLTPCRQFLYDIQMMTQVMAHLAYFLKIIGNKLVVCLLKGELFFHQTQVFSQYAAVSVSFDRLKP